MAKYWIDVDGERVEVDVEWTGDGYRATVDEKEWDVHVADVPTASSDAGSGGSIPEPSQPQDQRESPKDENVIYAPIAGSVSDILVGEGDSVEQGESVMKLEAMKMETEISSGKPGRVEEILVTQGERVEENQPLIRLET